MADTFLEVSGLSLSRGGRRVLESLSVAVARGEIFGLLGPNGAGKTSAFLALAGLIPVEAGEVRLGGQVMTPGDDRLRARTGVVFQSPALDDRLSLRTNLLLAAGLYGLRGARARERVAERLAFAGLEDRADERVKVLSGGLRRRVEIARALLNEPELLLLDEPTTGLDPASWRRTWDLLRRLAGEEGVTVLLTTHRAEEAEACDRLAFLNDGGLVALDTPEALRGRLGGDVVEVGVADPEAAAATLRQALELSPEVREGRVWLVTERGAELVPRIADALPKGTVRSIAVHRPGLADAFLTLTGRGLEEVRP